MNPDVGFPSFLVLTVLLLAGVVGTGMRARLKPHLILVTCAVASLGATIYFAERLGELYDLEAAGWVTPVHLTVAKVTTVAYLLPIITGVMTLRDRRHKPVHYKSALLVLTLTMLTALLGIWMLLASERIA